MLRGRDGSHVAAEFLLSIWRVQQEQSAPNSPPPTTPTTTLGDALTVIQSPSVATMTPPRQQAYVEWVGERAPLLATPESGLHRSAVNEFLEMHPNIGREGDHVHQARFERARITLETLSKGSLLRKEVDSALTAIDGAFDDHPWVKRFGVWKEQFAQDKQ